MIKVFAVGRLTKDPVLRQTQSGVPVCSFDIAVDRRFSKDEVDFFPVTVWRGQAEPCSKFLFKGSMVAVEGTLQNREYTYNAQKRSVTEVIASEVQFINQGTKTQHSQSSGLTEVSANDVQAEFGLEEISDDNILPF